VAVAFTSDDYAWLGYVNERFGAAPSADRDPFHVQRQLALTRHVGSGGRDLEGEGFRVYLDLDARQAVLSGERADAATDALLAALRTHVDGEPSAG
jgi:hypothetical protein